MMSKFKLAGKENMPQFVPFPKFLLGTRLSYLAMIIYTLLLDRARLSEKNGWKNEAGEVYVIYTVDGLAKALNKGETAVKKARKELSDAGLIRLEKLGLGKPSRTYVYVPDNQDQTSNEGEYARKVARDTDPLTDADKSLRQPKTGLTEERNAVSPTVVNASANNNYTKKPYSLKTERDDTPEHLPTGKKAYGTYKNVYLSDDEYAQLFRDLRNPTECIDNLSCYMIQKGKVYQNHAAVIRRWALKDGNLKRSASDLYEGGNHL